MKSGSQVPRDVEDATQALTVEIQRLETLHGALASRQVIGRSDDGGYAGPVSRTRRRAGDAR